MLIMGIDPGTRATGYGLVESRPGGETVFVDAGVISPQKPRDPVALRLAAIYAGLSRVLADYSPAAAAVEDIFLAGNVQAALRLGEVRGVIFLALTQAGVEIAEYSPPEIKKAVAGYGQATKDQVMDMVWRQLKLSRFYPSEGKAPAAARGPKPAPAGLSRDLSDALAAALCHAQTRRLKARIAGK